MSSSTPSPQLPPAGWYPDSEAPGLRWWDGVRWTDYRHAATSGQGIAPVQAVTPTRSDLPISLPVALALAGGVLAAVGALLPAADVNSSLHVAKNSLIQHPEGAVVLGVALLGVLSALRGSGALPVIAGVALVGLALFAGLHASSLVQPNAAGEELLSQAAGTALGERFSEAFDASPGPGIWSIGIAGALLILSGARRIESGSGET